MKNCFNLRTFWFICTKLRAPNQFNFFSVASLKKKLFRLFSEMCLSACARILIVYDVFGFDEFSNHCII